jgi:hypothetical protein
MRGAGRRRGRDRGAAHGRAPPEPPVRTDVRLARSAMVGGAAATVNVRAARHDLVTLPGAARRQGGPGARPNDGASRGKAAPARRAGQAWLACSLRRSSPRGTHNRGRLGCARRTIPEFACVAANSVSRQPSAVSHRRPACWTSRWPTGEGRWRHAGASRNSSERRGQGVPDGSSDATPAWMRGAPEVRVLAVTPCQATGRGELARRNRLPAGHAGPSRGAAHGPRPSPQAVVRNARHRKKRRPEG